MVSKVFLFTELCFILAIILIFICPYPINWILLGLLFGGGWIVYIVDWRRKHES